MPWLLAFGFFALVASQSAWEPVSEYPPWWPSQYGELKFQNVMWSMEKYAFAWNVLEYTNEIEVAVATDNLGWIGWGLSWTGSMYGGDLIVYLPAGAKLDEFEHGIVNETEAEKFGRLQDRFSQEPGRPSIDKQQNAKLLEGGQENGVTRAHFVRPLDSCDDKDIDISKKSVQPLFRQWVIFAYGEGDNLRYHTPHQRGGVFINFYHPPNPFPPEDPTDIKQVLTNSDIVIEQQTTSYMCQGFEFDVNNKFHLDRYTAISNSPALHHMILYSCDLGPLNNDFTFPPPWTSPHTCFDMNPLCSNIIGLWAPGMSNEFVFPPEAAIPIFPLPYPGSRLMIQWHFENFDEAPVTIGEIGFQLSLEPVQNPPTRYDMGIMMLGLPGRPHFLTIPEKEDITLTTAAVPACTEKFLPYGATIVGEVPHMHLLGKSMYIEHIRDGKQIGNISNHPYFDYNKPTLFGVDNVRVKPGDQFMTHCTYSNPEKHIVSGGRSLVEEMCFGFLWYYPLQPFRALDLTYAGGDYADTQWCKNIFQPNNNTVLPDGTTIPFTDKRFLMKYNREKVYGYEKSYAPPC